MPVDTTNNELLGFFRTRRVLDSFMIVFGLVACVLGAVYLENMYARVAICVLTAVCTMGAMVYVMISNNKSKDTDEENMVYLSPQSPQDGSPTAALPTTGDCQDWPDSDIVIIDGQHNTNKPRRCQSQRHNSHCPPPTYEQSQRQQSETDTDVPPSTSFLPEPEGQCSNSPETTSDDPKHITIDKR